MSDRSKEESYLHFRAPRQHGETLCIPAIEDVLRDMRGNTQGMLKSESRIDGSQLADLRLLARRELAANLQVVPDKLWIVGGHQPELFHPGVWLKNFVLDGLAKQTDGVALNLIVEHDVCNSITIRVPRQVGSKRLELETLSWDTHAQGVPWERHFVQSPRAFEAFAGQVTQRVRSLGLTPMIDAVWEVASAVVRNGGSAGDAFATARHAIEKKHGLRTTEFFSRQLVANTAFRKLLLHLIANRERYRQTHNESLAHYRLAHGIRSLSHPVPDLKREGAEVEIPLWVYSKDNPRRRSVFAGADESGCWLTDRNRSILSWSHRDSEEVILRSLQGLEENGVYLRPRALLTTMALRLLIADWFVHGIGGGKYDQLNDRIMHSFFSLDPPKFSVVSGTLYLPSREDVSDFREGSCLANDVCSQNYAEWLRVKSQWLETRQFERKQYYHPQKYEWEWTTQQKALLEVQKELLSKIPARGAKREWHAQLTKARSDLASHRNLPPNYYASRTESAWRELQQAQLGILRELSFVNYPQEWLVARLFEQTRLCFEGIRERIDGQDNKTTVHARSQTSSLAN